MRKIIPAAVYAKAKEGEGSTGETDQPEGEQPEGEQPEGEKSEGTEEGEQPEGEGTTGSEVTDGVRSRRGLTMKHLIPDQDWIMKNVVAGGKGTRGTVGRIFGAATGFQRKENEYQGNVIQSIVVTGAFNSESYITGEVSEATSVFLPMAYAEKIATLMEADKTIKVIEIDCDIGLEATGKTIPYEWVVIAYREGKEMAFLKRIRNARARPQNILMLPDGTAKALPAPTK